VRLWRIEFSGSVILTTTADLKAQTKGALAQLAKRLKVADWASLSKDQLVTAITKAQKKAGASSGSDKSLRSGERASGGKAKDKHQKSGVAGKTQPKTKPAVLSASRKTSSSTQAAAGNSKRTAAATTPAGKAVSTKPLAAKGSSAAKAASQTASAAPAKSQPKPPSKAIPKATNKTPSKAGAASKSALKAASQAEPAKSDTSGSGKAGGKAGEKGSDKASNKVIAKGTASSSGKSIAKGSTKPVMAVNGKVSDHAGGKSSGDAGPDRSGSKSKPAAKKAPVKPTNPEVLQRIRELQVQRESTKDLAQPLGAIPVEQVDESNLKDRIVLIVRDAHWLQVSWEVTRRAVERARAAMAEQWHTAQPILRLLRLDDGSTTSSAETIERDIAIHGGVRNWYIDLNGTPGRFRIMIGYLSGTRFHMLAKSNIIRSPVPGTTDAVDDHWSDIAKDPERIFALSGGYDAELETTELREVFEERLHRTMGGPALAQFGSGAEATLRTRGGFYFEMEVELYVHGSTVPDGFVTLNGEPVKLRSDGTFALRLPFPDRRQVLPAVACSRDGVQQRTVVVAVERNTKVMEPFSKEQDEPL
jgi:uncharacterized protein